MSRAISVLSPIAPKKKATAQWYKDNADLITVIEGQSYLKVNGKVYNLDIGHTKKVKFFVQEGERLLHFDSGVKICDLAPTRLKHMRSYVKLTERTAAELAILGIVERVTLEKVLNSFENTKKVNK